MVYWLVHGITWLLGGEHMSNSKILDTKDMTWAITEYFSRDRLEKSAASLGMARSALEEEDVFHFVQNLLFEAEKFQDSEIVELRRQLEYAYYGNGKIPEGNYEGDAGIVPLYFLRADNQSDDGYVRIRGINIGGVITEVVPWEAWQKLKLQSTRNVMKIAAKLVAAIEEKIDINPTLERIIQRILKTVEQTEKEWQSIDPQTFIIREEFEKDEELQFERQADHMRVKTANEDHGKRKYSVFSSDMFYNTQVLASQGFNEDDFTRAIYFATQLAGYLKNTLVTRKGEKIIVFKPQNPIPIDLFLNLVKESRMLSDIMNFAKDLTSSEKYLLFDAYRETQRVLLLCISKLFSISAWIMAKNPVKKRSSSVIELNW